MNTAPNLADSEIESLTAGVRTPKGPRRRINGERDMSDEHIPPGFVTGASIRRMVGLSIGQFRAYASKGLISAARDPNGNHRRGTRASVLFTREEAEKFIAYIKEENRKRADENEKAQLEALRPDPTVAMLPATRLGVAYTAEQGALVFARIDAGESLKDIVKAMSYHPAIVQSIARDYRAFENEIILPADVVAKISELPLPGELPSAPSKRAQYIYSLLLKLAADRQCKHCPERRPCLNACKICAAKAFARRTAQPTQGQAADEDAMEGAEAAADAPSDEPA